MALSCPAAFAQTEVEDSIGTQVLDEVVVEAEKPRLKGHDGVLVVDLPAIVADKPVTNILDALGFLPGVVSNDGKIGLNVAAGVTIILNGELTNMPVQNLYQLLYSLPVDRLKNVEIMYAAPAKYHVSGAVINIVLKTPRAIDGLRGQALLGYTQARYPSYNGTLAATYAVGDWTFDVNWSLSRNKTWNRQETRSRHLVDGHRVTIDDDMRQLSHSLSNILYASISYKRLKLTYNGQISTDAENKSLSSGTLGEYVNRYTFLSPTGYHNVALRYDAPFGLTVGGDYTNYREYRQQRLSKSDLPIVSAVNRQSIDCYHLYVDRQHQFGKYQFDYGVEYRHSDDHSRQHYDLPEQEGFDDVLKEDVVDGNVGLQASLDCGLSFNVSAKAEYFHNDYQHNWNFVPQLGATYYRTPVSIFQLNFTSRRVYPQYWELHGGTAHINDYSMIKGNPALQPYINYSGQFSYILRQKYVATLYLLYADKYAVQLPYQLPDQLQLLFQTVNLDFSSTCGLQLHAPFDIGNRFNSIAVVNIMRKQEKATCFHDIGFDNRRWSFYGALNNTVKITHSCPVSLSLDASYVTGQIQGPGKFNSLWKIDAGAKWQFGNARCCELDFKFNDIFNTWKPKLTIDHAGQDYVLRVHDMMRSLTLSFVWRFNGFKPKDSSADTSRFGTGR